MKEQTSTILASLLKTFAEKKVSLQNRLEISQLFKNLEESKKEQEMMNKIMQMKQA